MHFTQIIDVENLSPAFIDYVKAEFRGKKIKISVEIERDLRDYLMSVSSNHKRVLKSMKDIEKRQK